jgi:hypothetical protein
MEPQKRCGVKTLSQPLRLALGTIALYAGFLSGMATITAPSFSCTVHSATPTATAPRPKRQGFFNFFGRHHAVLKTIPHFSKFFGFFCQQLSKAVITLTAYHTMGTRHVFLRGARAPFLSQTPAILIG